MRRLAARGERRFEGMVRHGLLRASSWMASGWRWLSMAKGRRLIQTQKRTRGVLERMVEGGGRWRWWEEEGGLWVLVKVAAMPLMRPKKVLGKTMVLRSVSVKSQIEYRWKE